MANLRRFVLIVAAFLVGVGAVQCARAAEPPDDLCSLLPASELSKTLGQDYDSPQKSVAPRPAPDAVPGMDCNYQPRDTAGSKVLFRAYVDSSASAATLLFLRMSKFYDTITAVTGLGDEAYFDNVHGLHVRKGKVRFAITLVPPGDFTPAREKQMKDLATRVAAQL
ncbi:MAG TPA: hypothetical protein VI636_09005 [Candidatus Angelobacter sp.]